MKTLVIFSVLALSVAVTNAQEVIELKEAKVEASPLYEMSGNGNSFSVNIRENYAGEFQQDPMVFLERNFDINHFIAYTRDLKYDTYEINFISKKGKLVALYDEKGKLVGSHFKFRNVALPHALIQKLYQENQGWSLVKNTFMGREKIGKSKDSYYLLTMQKGKDKKRIKIDAVSGHRTQIANLD